MTKTTTIANNEKLTIHMQRDNVGVVAAAVSGGGGGSGGDGGAAVG